MNPSVADIARALIAEHDRLTLSPLREKWLAAKGVVRDALGLAIDAALDQRLRLMELRDAPAVSKAA